jgi:hypothetical protein
MQLLLDYIGSIIIGAALMMIILNANEMVSENQSVYNGDMLVQEMLVGTAHLLEGEFRNMGLGVPEDTRSILHADTSAIRFLYDIDRNGTPDTISYFAGRPDQMPGTQNELDRPLYRMVNSGSPHTVGVVTVFQMRYLTRLTENIPTPVAAANLGEIHSVEITMEVQNPYAVIRSDGTVDKGQRNVLYSSSLWQQTRLASQNSRR